MPSAFAHAVAGASIALAFHEPRALCGLAAALAVVPDVDILGFGLGVQYGDPLGHRGITHSLAFAALAALVFLLPGVRRRAPDHGAGRLWACGFLATASHGLLDALTNGAMGVAFLSPFELGRYFFPVRPIEVSPIGERFFSWRGVEVLENEILWVGIPCALLVAASRLPRRRS